jgi:RNA polymerase sigma-70 factor (ECF subfamily)
MHSNDRFTALVNAWSADLYRFAYWLTRDRASAEDLVQEAFLRAWRALSGLRDEQAAKSWLFSIVRNEYRRRWKSLAPAVSDPSEEPVDNADAVQDWLVRRQLQALPEEYREPLLLQVLGGFQCDEIAELLGVSRATVMTRLFRARLKLRAALTESPAHQPSGEKRHELP